MNASIATLDAEPTPSLRNRLLIALAIGLISAALTYGGFLLRPYLNAHDFTVFWVAGRALLHGHDPYDAVLASKLIPFAPYYFYPGSATLVSLAFAWPNMYASALLFSGVSAAVLAYAVTSDGYWRLPLFASAPFLMATNSVQWAPLIFASAFLPALGWMLAVKPTGAFIAFSYRPRWSAVILSGILGVVSLIVMPYWPEKWLHHIASHDGGRSAPFLHPKKWPLGFIGIVAVLRWRRPEARLILLLSLIPSVPWWYDQFPLWLVPSNGREMRVLTATSLAALTVYILNFGLWNFVHFPAVTPYISLGLFAPAVIMVLRRPNEGRIPAWLERVIARWPTWIRGRSTEAVR